MFFEARSPSPAFCSACAPGCKACLQSGRASSALPAAALHLAASWSLCLHLHWVPAGAEGAVALDMSKFFDTNYHYMVPELDSSSQPKADFKLLLDKVER